MKVSINFKRFLTADPGFILYNMDLAQAENRIVAYIAPEPLMINAFEHGIDLHKQTASLIYNVPISEVTDEQRQWGKKANHGLNYGLGYRKFAFLYEIPENQAQFIVEKYHSIYPGVRQYHKWVEAAIRRSRTLITAFGRTRVFKGKFDDELLKEAYSYIPQSITGDCINIRAVDFIYYDDRLQHVQLLNQVHDSISFQISKDEPIERHAEALRIIRESLEAPIEWKGSSFKIPADIEVGFNMKDTKKLKGWDGSVEQLEKTVHLMNN